MLQPLHLLKPLSAVPPAVAHPAFSSKTLMRQLAGVVLVTLALAGCSVPLALLAMHAAEYAFGW